MDLCDGFVGAPFGTSEWKQGGTPRKAGGKQSVTFGFCVLI